MASQTCVDNLKIVSLNVRGINNFKKRRSIFNYCRKQKADLFLLQETHGTKQVEMQWQHEWGGKILFSHGSNNSRGVAIIFRNGSNIDVKTVINDDEGRILIVKCVKDDLCFTLINVYAPNAENLQTMFYKNLNDSFVDKYCYDDERIIIGGDFNCILNANLDKKGGHERIKENVVEKISDLIDNFDLVDVWRFLNPNKSRFTWRQLNPLIQCRLDYFLISNSLLEYVSHTDIIPGIRTDHSAIVLDIQIQKDPTRGPGHWKFNNSYLKDDEYVNTMNNNLILWLNNNSFVDSRVKWEWIKFKVRDETMKYAKLNCKKRKDRMKVLFNKMNSLEESLANDPSDDILNNIELVKNELEELDLKTVDGLIVRSRIRWAEKGEKSNKYFLGLEKRNCRKKQCKKLVLDDDSIIVKPDLILNAQSEYYKNLYESKIDSSSIRDNFFLHGDSIPTLNDTDAAKCDGKLSLAECYNVLSKMSKNKSPGNDGLSCEWYIEFWAIIGNFLVSVLNDGLCKGELSSSQRQAVITLIEKEGKDRCKLKNWRPISLLNVDYKIASKALAMRVEKIIHQLINPDQSGFVKGRLIGESVRTIQDIMDFTKNKNIPGLLLFLDFEKAFDSLEWNFLFSVLERMNFGSDFVNYVKALYKNISSCVLNNGFTSNYFTVERGVRQGDPLSSYLFILAIELLSCKIRENSLISGIQIADTEIKLIQYADDTTCVLRDVQSATHLLNLVQKFTEVSGLKLNVSKSQAMWIGSQRNSNDKPLDVEWPREPIKALGVYFSYDEAAAENMNFAPKIKQVKTLLNIWKSRCLTLAGKILLIKTFALSRFIYLASVIHFPDTIIYEIDKIIYNFLWNGGRGFIKKSTIIGDIDEGGLKMVDVKSIFAAQKIKWVNKYNTTSAHWKLFFNDFTASYGGSLIFHCNVNTKYIKKAKCIPIFYKDMLIAYFNFINPGERSPFQQCIWNNQYICINQKPVFYQHFLDCGLTVVSDLYYTDGTVIPFNVWVERGLSRKYYLQWRGMISAVPTFWKQTLKSGFDRDICILKGFTMYNNGIDIDMSTMTSRCIYRNLVTRTFNPPTSQAKFTEELDIDINEWSQIYISPFKSTFDVKTRIFQYKINLNCLMTNYRLHKMNLVETRMCTFCSNNVEKMRHLFWDCPCVTEIWDDFKLWYDTNFNTDIVLDYKSIIFGMNRDSITNLCLILVKKVIYYYRFKKQKPSFVFFKILIKFHYRLEKQIAMNNNTMYKFMDKWNCLETFCSEE